MTPLYPVYHKLLTNDKQFAVAAVLWAADLRL
jgi:hypothetical protein